MKYLLLMFLTVNAFATQYKKGQCLVYFNKTKNEYFKILKVKKHGADTYFYNERKCWFLTKQDLQDMFKIDCKMLDKVDNQRSVMVVNKGV